MLKVLKNIGLYAGIDRVSYTNIKPKIQNNNRIMTSVLSLFASILIAIMWLTSFKTASVSMNRTVYLVGLILSIIVFFISQTVARKASWLISILMYISYSIYYLYGIFIGAVTDPEGKTVTFIVMLVFIPTLFCDRPLRMAGSVVFFEVVFIVLCHMNKTEPTLSVDIIDAVMFGALGIASGTTISCMKAKSYVNEQKLQEIGRIDQLTKINNRNAYEIDRYHFARKCRHSLACIFIDVNGLHELNKRDGHEAGDEMLKTIANLIKHYFGEELSYRIGGDEFVIFIPDSKFAECKNVIDQLKKDIEADNYHIAVGYSAQSTRRLNILELVNAAEKEMYDNKQEYYNSIETGESIRNSRD